MRAQIKHGLLYHETQKREVDDLQEAFQRIDKAAYKKLALYVRGIRDWDYNLSSLGASPIVYKKPAFSDLWQAKYEVSLALASVAVPEKEPPEKPSTLPTMEGLRELLVRATEMVSDSPEDHLKKDHLLVDPLHGHIRTVTFDKNHDPSHPLWGVAERPPAVPPAGPHAGPSAGPRPGTPAAPPSRPLHSGPHPETSAGSHTRHPTVPPVGPHPGTSAVSHGWPPAGPPIGAYVGPHFGSHHEPTAGHYPGTLAGTHAGAPWHRPGTSVGPPAVPPAGPPAWFHPGSPAGLHPGTSAGLPAGDPLDSHPTNWYPTGAPSWHPAEAVQYHGTDFYHHTVPYQPPPLDYTTLPPLQSQPHQPPQPHQPLHHPHPPQYHGLQDPRAPPGDRHPR